MDDFIKVDLKNLIQMLSIQFPNVETVHLFGSRAYQTNSKRSDIDLLILFDPKNATCDKSKLQKFQEGYPYIDIFINRIYSAQSIVNNSEILKKEKFFSIEEQLDAILLWSKECGYKEENNQYFIQELAKNQTFHPSYIPMNNPLLYFEQIVHNCVDITNEQKIYLNEAIKCHINECYLGFISLLGTYYEDLLIQLCKTYENRIRSHFSVLLTVYQNNVINCKKAKKRLENLIDFIKNSSNDINFFKSNGIESLNDISLTFDVIRKYRNDIDHPTGRTVNEVDCSSLIQIFVSYVRNIYDIMKKF